MLMCQYVTNHPTHFPQDAFASSYLVEYLVSVLSDEQMCYENRLDAADIVLNIPDVEDAWRNLAIDTIDICGRQTSQFSFYHNQENIHYVDISSIEVALEYLNHTYPTQSRLKHRFDDSLLTKVKKMDAYQKANETERKNIHVAIVRIQNDRSSYGPHSNSLYEVTSMVLSHIESHTHRSELQSRLIEELLEMSGKCATGYVIRMVNVLSGFDDKFSVRVPVTESMKSLLFHRLNEKIFAIEDEEVKSDILYEITLPSSVLHLRQNFLKFFRDVFPSLENEMFEHFKDQMTDTEFDMCLRNIVIQYEGYEAS